MALSADSEQHWANLLRALRRSPGFSLHIVAVHSNVRDEVLRRLRKQLPQSAPHLTWLTPGAPGLDQLQGWLDNRSAPSSLQGLVVADGDALLSHDDGHLIAALNVVRDLLGDYLGGPLVLVVSPLGAARIPGLAPDFFQVRAGTYLLRQNSPTRTFRQLAIAADSLPSLDFLPLSKKKLRARREQLKNVAEIASHGLSNPRFIDQILHELLVDSLDHISAVVNREEAQLLADIERTAQCLIKQSALLDYQASLCRLHEVLMVLYRTRGQRNLSIEAGRRAIHHAKLTGLTEQLVDTLNAVAANSFILGEDPGDVLDIYRQSRSIHLISEMRSRSRIFHDSAFLMNAAAHIENGDPSAAMDLLGLEQMQILSSHPKFRVFFAFCYSVALIETGHPEEAARFLEDPLPNIDDYFARPSLQQVHHLLSEVVDTAVSPGFSRPTRTQLRLGE